MTVYVDELFPTRRSARWRYDQACHMFADTDEELHAMAARLRLRKAWAQSMDHVRQFHHHYDLTASKRKHAISMGAVPLSMREAAAMYLTASDHREAVPPKEKP